MKRLAMFLALIGGLGVVPAGPAAATWTGNNCFSNNAADSNYRRIDARAYVGVALHEGYEWGGGCWNNN